MKVRMNTPEQKGGDVQVSLAILNSSVFFFFRSSRRSCRWYSTASVNVGSSPSSISPLEAMRLSVVASFRRARMGPTPLTALLVTRSMSLSTGREYGRGGRGAKSFRRLGGKRWVPGIVDVINYQGVPGVRLNVDKGREMLGPEHTMPTLVDDGDEERFGKVLKLRATRNSQSLVCASHKSFQ